jgi:hypothetical protein
MHTLVKAGLEVDVDTVKEWFTEYIHSPSRLTPDIRIIHSLFASGMTIDEIEETCEGLIYAPHRPYFDLLINASPVEFLKGGMPFERIRSILGDRTFTWPFVRKAFIDAGISENELPPVDEAMLDRIKNDPYY